MSENKCPYCGNYHPGPCLVCEKCDPSTPSKDLLKDGEHFLPGIFLPVAIVPVKNTTNSCNNCKGISESCDKGGAWVYCDALQILLGDKTFDETGEKDGCNLFRPLHQAATPSNGEKVYRWVKASERLPEKAGKHNEVTIRSLKGFGKDPFGHDYPHAFQTTGFKNYDEETPRLYFLIGNKSFLTNENIEWQEEMPSVLNQPDGTPEYEKWLNQPGIDREETGKVDNTVGWFEYNHEKQTETYTKNPNFGKPVDAVNAPAENTGGQNTAQLPDDVLGWVRFKEDEYSHQKSDQDAYRQGAIDLYWEWMLKEKNAARLSFVKFAYGCMNERDALQASLSSKKEERDKALHQQELLGFEIINLSERLHKITTDRDLYRKESESYCLAWNESTATIAEKNIQIAEMKEEIQDYRRLLFELREDPGGYSWTLREVKKLLNKYPKKEEPKP